MIRIDQLIDLSWIDNRHWHVPHSLGTQVLIVGADLPADVTLPTDAITSTDLARACRINDRREARQFLAARAVQRSVLAGLLGCPRSKLTIAENEYGKPRITGNSLHFNMSRSGSIVLLAVSTASPIGADVEAIRAIPDLDALARTHLTPSEYDTWRARDSTSREHGFLSLWTRKEACVKAAGVGLTMPFEGVDIGSTTDRRTTAFRFQYRDHHWCGQVESVPVLSRLAAVAVIT